VAKLEAELAIQRGEEAPEHPLENVELVTALTLVGKEFERITQESESLKRSKVIIERSSKDRGDDKARVSVRVLATETHKLFGKYLCGTLAKVATVALQTDVTEKSVRNWCADIEGTR
jgi:hypothetical protein